MDLIKCNDAPSHITMDQQTLYLVNSKWLFFKCPCNCDAKIMLNIHSSLHPYWNVIINKDNTITINPSIKQLDCGAHFFIKNNQIVWC